MRHAPFVVFSMLALLCFASPAHAGDDPTPAELADLILNGNAGEHALVAAWLEDADRATLRAVFEHLRAARREEPSATRTAPEAVPAPTVRFVPEREPIRPKDAEKGDAPLLQAEVRVIDVAADRAADILGTARPKADRTYVSLSRAEAEALLRKVERDADATIVTAPRLTTYFGQKANVTLTNQVSYVKDYEIEKAKDGSVIADPVVATIQEGLVIDLVGNIGGDGKTIEVEFTGTWAELKRPIGELETEIEGQKLTIQLPELAVVRARAAFELPSDGWAVLGGGRRLGTGEDAVERIALLHLTRIDPGTAAPRRAVPPPPPAPVLPPKAPRRAK